MDGSKNKNIHSCSKLLPCKKENFNFINPQVRWIRSEWSDIQNVKENVLDSDSYFSNGIYS